MTSLPAMRDGPEGGEGQGPAVQVGGISTSSCKRVRAFGPQVVRPGNFVDREMRQVDDAAILAQRQMLGARDAPEMPHVPLAAAMDENLG